MANILPFLLLLTAAALAVRRGGPTPHDLCVPDCSDRRPGAYVEDPTNCTQYYLCLQDGLPSDHAIPCGAGEAFDPEAEGCVQGEPSSCAPRCRPPSCHLTCNGTFDVVSDPFDCGVYYVCLPGQAEGPVSCPPDSPFFDGAGCVHDDSHCCRGLCSPYCHPGSFEIPDPFDCTKYYICLEEGAADEGLHFSCPAGEVFDVPMGRCGAGDQCRNLCPRRG